MWSWLSRALAAPRFEDEGEARVAELLNVINLFFIALAFGYSVLAPVLSSPAFVSLAFTLAILVSLILTRALLLRRRVRQASLLLVAALWAIITLYTFLGGGVRAPGFTSLVIIILVAGLLLDSRASLVVAGLSLLAGLAALLLEGAGYLPAPIITLTPFAEWFLQAVNFIAIAAVFYLAIRSQTEALARARRALAERLQAEAELRASEERFRRVIEASPMGVHLYSVDPQGQLIFRLANPAADRILNVDNTVFVGQTIEAAFPPLQATEIPARYRQVAVAGGVWHTEQVNYQDDRIVGAFDVYAFQTKPGEMVALFLDVTERRAAEARLRLSDATYRGILDSVTEAIYIQDGQGHFLDVNRAAETMYGYPRADFLGQDPDFLSAPGRNDLAATATAVQRALAGEPQHLEFWGRARDGRVFPKDVSLTPGVYFGQTAVIAVARDVTERKQAEAALRDNEARTRVLAEAAQRQARELALLDSVRNAIAKALDLPALFRTVVEATAESLGYSQVSLYWRDGDCLRLQHQVGYPGLVECIPVTEGVTGRVARTGQPVWLSDVRADPDYLDLLTGIGSEVCVPLLDRDQVAGILNVESLAPAALTEADLNLMTALSRQIGVAIERARLYTEVRASEQRFRALLENSADIISVIDSAGTVLYASPSSSRVLGYALEDQLGTNVLDDIHPDDRALTEAILGEVSAQAGDSTQHAFRFRHQDGSWRWLEATATNLLAEPSVRGIVINYRDITERRQAEAALRESERLYRDLFGNAPAGLALTSLDGYLFAFNDEFCRPGGYERDAMHSLGHIGRLYADPEQGAALLAQARRQGAVKQVEVCLRDRAGGDYDALLSLTPVQIDGQPCWQVMVQDITERKRADETLRRSLAELETLQRITQSLLSLEALTQSMEIVAQGLVLSQGYDFVLVSRYFEAEAVFRGVALYPPPTPELVAQALAAIGLTGQSDAISDLRLPYALGSNPMVDRVLDGEVGLSKTAADFLEPWVPRPVAEALDALSGLRTYINLPLRVKGRTVGTILAGTRQPVVVPGQLEALSRVADQAALASERERLYEAERERAAELADANQQLRRSEERYALAARAANDGLWDADLRTATAYYSPRWKAMFGYADDEIGQHLDDWFARIHPEDLDQVRARLAAHLDGTTPHFESEHRIRHRDGSYRWVLSRGLAVRDAAGFPQRLAGSVTEITERKRAEAQLLHDAFHDALTGLPNRALFNDRLEQAVKHARRREGYTFAVLYLDVDRFKVVNDSLGHTIGDQLLVAIAQRLGKGLRVTDTFARLGGDEFVILLDDVRSHDEVLTIANRIQEQLAEPFDLGGLEMVSSASLGIVLSEATYDGADDLLRDADIAMYRAKALGRARHVVFTPAMRADALARLRLEAELRRALERGEFLVYYQPIVRLRDERLIGFEALVRWQHPERGLLPPGAFVPVAEDSGLIIPLDRWVMQTACRQLRLWQAGFPSEPPLSLNVNVSGRHFTRPDLVGEIEAALLASGLPPASLRLEITESVIMENIGLATVILNQLHGLGIQIEIDDFGTGYSSLGYLVQLPVDTLKIDRSFVSRMAPEGGQSEIVNTILTLAQNLRMMAIAEGIETPAQRDRLLALGCEYGQGYLIAPPLPEARAAEWLTANRGAAAAPSPKE